MRMKLAVTALVILLALIALFIRIWKIQSDYSDEYNQTILSQQKYDSRDIPARRGDITDRNGTFLATSTKVYNLIIDPSQINADQEDHLEPTVALLNEVYGYDTGELRSLIAEKADSQYIRYAKQLSFDEMNAFETRKEEINREFKKKGDTRRIHGVWFEDSYQRFYPNNSVAGSVVGFAMNDGLEGSGGMEQYYNDQLTGINGREYGYLNDDSNLERIIKPAQDGNTIVSTIDVNVQQIVEKYIAQFQEQMGSKTAACIIMDPANGEIMAMADSRPYDLNDPRDVSAYFTQEELDAMDDKALGDAWNTIWRNFCISDTYEPGSTSKIFTVSAALEEGSITGNETYNCDGFQEVGGWKIKCNKVTGHGLLSVEEGLMQSCNDVMMQIVAGLGRDKFCKFMDIFGFGQKTGIDLPGEADTSKLVHSAATMVPSDLATNSFGQNYNCTMIQMAAAYCSVINGGSYYEPHVVKQIVDPQGSVVESMEPKLVRQTVSSDTAAFIRKALFRTVTEGTGGAAEIPGYHIGGKTGTAEKYPRGTNNYLVSFIGFAPVEDPQVVCYVIVDEPNTDDQAHSSFASGIFRNIMRDVLPYLNIYREGDDSEYAVLEDVVFGDGAETKPDQGGQTEKKETEAETESVHNADTEKETVSGGEAQDGEPQETEAQTRRAFDRDEFVEPQSVEEGQSSENLPGIPAGIENAEIVPELPSMQ